MSGVSATHPRQSQAQAPGPNPGAQPPKRAPAAEPPQQHPAGQTHPRETKAKHPAQTQRRSHPNAPRRQSRRSSTQPDIRTHARRRPSTQSKLQRHRHPNAPRRQGRSSTRQGKRTQRKTKGPAAAYGRIIPPNAGPRAQTTRTRQRRAAQAAQTAVGDAQERILLRDDHAESFRQRKVTSHPTPAKSAFLWGYPRFFWQDKRNGVQRA